MNDNITDIPDGLECRGTNLTLAIALLRAYVQAAKAKQAKSNQNENMFESISGCPLDTQEMLDKEADHAEDMYRASVVYAVAVYYKNKEEEKGVSNSELLEAADVVTDYLVKAKLRARKAREAAERGKI